MGKEYSLKIPLSLDDVTLDQYQRYIKVIEENKEDLNNEFIKLKVLEIFCQVPLAVANELAAIEVDEIVNLILAMLNMETPLQRRFTMTDPTGKSIEFGFIPNLEKISQGEYIDAELFFANWDDMHKAMAVFYRPITGKKGEFYQIEKYEGVEKYEAHMKDAPASVAIGAMLFFYHLGTALLNDTLASLEREERMRTDLLRHSQQESHLEGSGDGTNHYTHSLEEMLYELRQSQNYLFKNVSSGLSTRRIESK